MKINKKSTTRRQFNCLHN